MSFANVRKFLNRQMGATTGRIMQSDRELGFNPLVAAGQVSSGTPAKTNSFAPAITPGSPVEKMMFASEPVASGPGADPSVVGPTDAEAQAANASLLGFTDNPLTSALSLTSYSNPATAIVGKIGKEGLQALNNVLGDPYGKAKSAITNAYDYVKAAVLGGGSQGESVDFGPITGTGFDPSVASAVTGFDVDAVSGASPSFGSPSNYGGAMGFDGGMAGIAVGGDVGGPDADAGVVGF